MTTTSENISSTVNDAKNLNIAYILYGLGLFTGIAVIAGLIFAYICKPSTHRQFLIRTFWFTLLFGFIAALLSFVVIGFLLLPVIFIWYLVRIISGWKVLNGGKELQNPKSLGFVAK